MAAFTPGNIVVYRIGTGSAALSSAAQAVFLDEYTPAGVLVQSIALPTADSGANQSLTASGTATSEGLLTRSADGQYIVLTGYDAAPGTASVSGTATTSVTRVIGRVDASGGIDTSTTTTAFTANNIRSATSDDGTGFWATGANTGVVYTPLGGSGAGTVVSSTVTNNRSISIFDGQLYYSTGSGTTRGVYAVGTGLPTTTSNTATSFVNLGGSASPFQFFFLDLTATVAGLDTLYITDDSVGVTKYSLVAGVWTSNGTVGTNADDYRGLTATVASGTVTLFATRDSGASADTLVSIVDSSGYNAAFSATPTVLATAATNTAFRGVALTPQSASEAQVVSIAVDLTTSAEGNAGSVVYTFTVTRTGGTTGALDFVANFGAGTTNAADTGGVAPGTVNGTIAAGQASTTFTVTVSGDTIVEGDESFTYTIASVTNASATPTIGTALATATITNDDGGITGSSVAGTSAANTFTGTPLNDIFLLQSGGDDTVTGAAGNDGFYFGGAFTAADSVDGGMGTLDQIALQGDYSAGVTLSATSAVGVEQFVLLPGSDTRFGAPGSGTSAYNIVTGDAAIGASQRMVFQGNQLAVGENFTLDASGETNGSVFTYGGRGNDVLTGSQNADAFFFGGTRFGAGDIVDGQGGSDSMALQGVYTGANAVTFGAGQLLNLEMLVLLGNNDSRFGGAGSGTAYGYDIVTNNGNVAAGGRLVVQGNTLASDEALNFNGSAELDGAYTIFSGNGADVIVGSAGADIISGRGSADSLTGGAGNDTFSYSNVTDSITTAQDTILDFTVGDTINLSAIDAITTTAGNNAFSFIGAGAFTNVAGQLRAVNTGGNDWLIEGDINGDNTADISILVTTSDADPILATDFIL